MVLFLAAVRALDVEHQHLTVLCTRTPDAFSRLLRGQLAVQHVKRGAEEVVQERRLAAALAPDYRDDVVRIRPVRQPVLQDKIAELVVELELRRYYLAALPATTSSPRLSDVPTHVSYY